MELACAKPEFFEATSVANQWEVERPFFNVPPGQDGLGAYLRSAGGRGVDLYRAIDRQTRAKSVFVKAGIPGSVGSAACALWSELGALMTTDRQLRVAIRGRSGVVTQNGAGRDRRDLSTCRLFHGATR